MTVKEIVRKERKILGRLLLVKHLGQLDFTNTSHIPLFFFIYGIADGVVEWVLSFYAKFNVVNIVYISYFDKTEIE